MSIRTTIYVRSNVLKVLDDLSLETGYSRTKIIHLVLNMAKNDRNMLLNGISAVKYQKKDEDEKWHRFHISFNEGFYDLCIDFRKLYRRSLSLILALALKKYEQKIREAKLIKKGDNYPSNSFILVKHELEDAVLFIHTWGIPEEMPEYVKNLI